MHSSSSASDGAVLYTLLGIHNPSPAPASSRMRSVTANRSDCAVDVTIISDPYHAASFPHTLGAISRPRRTHLVDGFSTAHLEPDECVSLSVRKNVNVGGLSATNESEMGRKEAAPLLAGQPRHHHQQQTLEPQAHSFRRAVHDDEDSNVLCGPSDALYATVRPSPSMTHQLLSQQQIQSPTTAVSSGFGTHQSSTRAPRDDFDFDFFYSGSSGGSGNNTGSAQFGTASQQQQPHQQSASTDFPHPLDPARSWPPQPLFDKGPTSDKIDPPPRNHFSTLKTHKKTLESLAAVFLCERIHEASFESNAWSTPSRIHSNEPYYVSLNENDLKSSGREAIPPSFATAAAPPPENSLGDQKQRNATNYNELLDGGDTLRNTILSYALPRLQVARKSSWGQRPDVCSSATSTGISNVAIVPSNPAYTVRSTVTKGGTVTVRMPTIIYIGIVVPTKIPDGVVSVPQPSVFSSAPPSIECSVAGVSADASLNARIEEAMGRQMGKELQRLLKDLAANSEWMRGPAQTQEPSAGNGEGGAHKAPTAADDFTFEDAPVVVTQKDSTQKGPVGETCPPMKRDRILMYLPFPSDQDPIPLPPHSDNSTVSGRSMLPPARIAVAGDASYHYHHPPSRPIAPYIGEYLAFMMKLGPELFANVCNAASDQCAVCPLAEPTGGTNAEREGSLDSGKSGPAPITRPVVYICLERGDYSPKKIDLHGRVVRETTTAMTMAAATGNTHAGELSALVRRRSDDSVWERLLNRSADSRKRTMLRIQNMLSRERFSGGDGSGGVVKKIESAIVCSVGTFRDTLGYAPQRILSRAAGKKSLRSPDEHAEERPQLGPKGKKNIPLGSSGGADGRSVVAVAVSDSDDTLAAALERGKVAKSRKAVSRKQTLFDCDDEDVDLAEYHRARVAFEETLKGAVTSEQHDGNSKPASKSEKRNNKLPHTTGDPSKTKEDRKRDKKEKKAREKMEGKEANGDDDEDTPLMDVVGIISNSDRVKSSKKAITASKAMESNADCLPEDTPLSTLVAKHVSPPTNPRPLPLPGGHPPVKLPPPAPGVQDRLTTSSPIGGLPSPNSMPANEMTRRCVPLPLASSSSGAITTNTQTPSTAQLNPSKTDTDKHTSAPIGPPAWWWNPTARPIRQTDRARSNPIDLLFMDVVLPYPSSAAAVGTASPLGLGKDFGMSADPQYFATMCKEWLLTQIPIQDLGQWHTDGVVKLAADHDECAATTVSSTSSAPPRINDGDGEDNANDDANRDTAPRYEYATRLEIISSIAKEMMRDGDAHPSPADGNRHGVMPPSKPLVFLVRWEPSSLVAELKHLRRQHTESKAKWTVTKTTVSRSTKEARVEQKRLKKEQKKAKRKDRKAQKKEKKRQKREKKRQERAARKHEDPAFFDSDSSSSSSSSDSSSSESSSGTSSCSMSPPLRDLPRDSLNTSNTTTPFEWCLDSRANELDRGLWESDDEDGRPLLSPLPCPASELVAAVMEGLISELQIGGTVSCRQKTYAEPLEKEQCENSNSQIAPAVVCGVGFKSDQTPPYSGISPTDPFPSMEHIAKGTSSYSSAVAPGNDEISARHPSIVLPPILAVDASLSSLDLSVCRQWTMRNIHKLMCVDIDAIQLVSVCEEVTFEDCETLFKTLGDNKHDQAATLRALRKVTSSSYANLRPPSQLANGDPTHPNTVHDANIASFSGQWGELNDEKNMLWAGHGIPSVSWKKIGTAMRTCLRHPKFSSDPSAIHILNCCKRLGMRASDDLQSAETKSASARTFYYWVRGFARSVSGLMCTPNFVAPGSSIAALVVPIVSHVSSHSMLPSSVGIATANRASMLTPAITRVPQTMRLPTRLFQHKKERLVIRKALVAVFGRAFVSQCSNELASHISFMKQKLFQALKTKRLYREQTGRCEEGEVALRSVSDNESSAGSDTGEFLTNLVDVVNQGIGGGDSPPLAGHTFCPSVYATLSGVNMPALVNPKFSDAGKSHAVVDISLSDDELTLHSNLRKARAMAVIGDNPTHSDPIEDQKTPQPVFAVDYNDTFELFDVPEAIFREAPWSQSPRGLRLTAVCSVGLTARTTVTLHPLPSPLMQRCLNELSGSKAKQSDRKNRARESRFTASRFCFQTTLPQCRILPRGEEHFFGENNRWAPAAGAACAYLPSLANASLTPSLAKEVLCNVFPEELTACDCTEREVLETSGQWKNTPLARMSLCRHRVLLLIWFLGLSETSTIE